ncbi:mannose-1-phosphate guanylyltransferase [Novosphingobium piscinae]|uniref:Mannose-1-phosphate guanylyltransferase n=1 Tax=Novosphingobium piscinae TaxID=1507448 RepID=A0A7X1KPE3_9SPHN|nr:sugar phosphate nucleotidyltransferase [Novosphingobium piscinae]MBC2668398.1 mannose-1-phosphate guanylyltransferase [Novosphingobium piscinae]
MQKVTPVILCGGSGTRLWPRSRAAKPKPFLPLVGSNTLFEATVARCADPARFAAPMVVTGKAHLAHVEAQLGPDGGEIIVEPCPRNTAAAIALAALRLPEEAVMLVCPSDHHIADPAAFVAAAAAAAELAAQDWLVSFGIEARAPETGFGYLKRGEPIGAGPGSRVAQFVEKPDLARARQFLASGDYAWNGGIFAFRAGFFLSELARHRPDIAAAARAAAAGGQKAGGQKAAGQGAGAQFHPDAAAFAAIRSESVDYAVMEHTDRAAMVPADMGWSDIGNWEALHAARPRDADGNHVSGPAELIDCRNVLVDSDGPRVNVIGLEHVMIVVDKGEILVTTAAGAQQVGKLHGAANQ